jgi:probable phosphoglycerate mutase
MIYLIRQGQTDWNLNGLFNGETETPINQTGVEQSELLAEKLRDVAFDVCFCSPQLRARQSCEIIYQGEITFDDRLCEIRCGDFEGSDETAEATTDFLRASKAGDRGVEMLDDFFARNFSFCDMVKLEYKGKNVLIVTHAINTRAMIYYLQGMPTDYDFSLVPLDSGEMMMLEN